ncbi:MAG: hypothetical protein B6244_08245 [Candidatus Cloacimonetes bacterium 4572_55]|nr:MAG: hypothetical protein B6244_08245 [Candidatus Cloacimonetes bacterium 4572_55]
MKINSRKGSSLSQFIWILSISLFSGLFGGALVWGVFNYDITSLPDSFFGLTVSRQEEKLSGSAHPVSYDNSNIDNSRRNAIVQAAEQIGPAVVTINAIQTRYVRSYDSFYNDFFSGFFRNLVPPQVYQEKIPSLGSGFIINKDGYILTNEHVVSHADEINVIFTDGREFEAVLVGSDPESDIAALKISVENPPYVTLGDSDELLIGEWAMAIGNPFGNLLSDTHPSVTVGVISALNRDFKPQQSDDRSYRNMIQTDAAINPGNSGGPLVNSLGEVIGINTFIFTQGGGSIGIGFAIPINHAKKVFNEINEYGNIRDVWIGLEVQAISPAIVRSLRLQTKRGLIVTRIEKSSSAHDAGFEPADVIREIDGVPVNSYEDADTAFIGKRVGDSVRCIVERNGRQIELSMTLKGLSK